jgi:hypothetical protein
LETVLNCKLAIIRLLGLSLIFLLLLLLLLRGPLLQGHENTRFIQNGERIQIEVVATVLIILQRSCEYLIIMKVKLPMHIKWS